jgi:Transposase DDE domain
MSTQSRMGIAIEVSPLTVLVRGVLEWACPGPFFDNLFDREARPKQWTRKLNISAITWLMLTVVSGARRSVFAAFQADQASAAPTILASAAALYAKYGRIDPAYTTAVVRESGRRMQALLNDAGVKERFGWEGYRITILDGTDLAGTEHRLKPLRTIKAAGLPGRYVAAYDLATELVIDAAASEDAYTSERELVRGLLMVAVAGQLFVADRHFCTTEILFAIMDRRASFVIRQHTNLRWHPLKELEAVGRVATGEVLEQPIEVEDTGSGERRRMRRIVLRLDTPTEDGDTEIALLTDLKGICPLRICELYRDRWSIERHFSLVKTVLHGEIEGLGRPRAALFAMGMALVAANALNVVKQALRRSHGEAEFEKLSGYYMADEVAGNYRAVDVLVTEAEWQSLGGESTGGFWRWCQEVAPRVRTEGLHKHPRGPKKAQPRRASGKDRHHYSTYRLLNNEDP